MSRRTDIVDVMPTRPDRRFERDAAAAARRPPKRSELIARELASYIVDNQLGAGSMLPNEAELIKQFGVGRTTLREALRLLETRGVLTIRSGPGGGPVVGRPTAADFSNSLNFILQFEHASWQGLLTSRLAIEPAVARLAAQRATDADAKLLFASIEALQQHPGDLRFAQNENGRFHAALARAGGNVALRFFVDATRISSDDAVAKLLYAPRRLKSLQTGHRDIADAVAARDPDAAEESMRAHLEEALEYVRRVYSQMLDEPIRWIG
jgi:DNA-binding FadR family transcriptional regulator